MKYKILIHNALLKYGHSNFSLEILEICEKQNTILREQFYLDKLKPDDNILQKAGSLLSFKHSKQTRVKMSSSNAGEKSYVRENRSKPSNVW